MAEVALYAAKFNRWQGKTLQKKLFTLFLQIFLNIIFFFEKKKRKQRKKKKKKQKSFRAGKQNSEVKFKRVENYALIIGFVQYLLLLIFKSN